MNLPTTHKFSPVAAFADVMKTRHKFRTDIDEFPELADYLMTWDLAHPVTPGNVLTQLYGLSSRFQDLANYTLDNRIGGTDNRGLVMRLRFSQLVKAIGAASTGLQVEAASSEYSQRSRVFFNTDWIQLAHRLVDEHKLRDTAEGDELS